MQSRRFGLSFIGWATLGLLPALAVGCGSGSATATTGVEAKPRADDLSLSSAANVSEPRQKPKLLPGAKTKVLAAAGDKPYDKTFDDLRFEIKLGDRFQRGMLTDSIDAMFGQRVRIRGFILPTAQKSGIREFVLVRDNQECCFGPGAALYDCIFVEMKDDKTADFSIRPVAVEGTFGLQEILGPDGRHLAIYHLDGESVR